MKQNHDGGSRILDAAVAVIVVILGLIVDVRIGVGVLAGVLVGVFVRPVLKEMFSTGSEVSQQENRFLDTSILRENFSIPQNLPIPYAVLDVRGRVMMYNEPFAAVFPHGEDAKPVIDQLLKTSGAGEPCLVTVGEKRFTAALNHCDVLDQSGAVGAVLTLIMVDSTRTCQLEKQLEEQETVVGMILLDNYDDVVDSVDEDRLPVLSALIDRKFNQLAAAADGVIKKLEKDRYIFLLSKGSLERFQEKKFEPFNEIKEISVGQQIPVTLSMGIGLGGGSLEAAMQNAKAAMDLALGRGGDQVLIKDGEKYLFFGGKSGEIHRNARIRARVKADALFELMRDASDILVMGHKQADLDSLGSCMGVYAMAKSIGKKCNIVMDKVSVGVKRLCDQMAQNEKYNGLIVNGAEAMRLLNDKTLVIVVDTHRESMVDSRQIVMAAKKIVVFDHHRKSTDFIDQAVLIYHEPYASSTAELITEMIQHMDKKVKLTSIEADALLAGITVDTKNFCVKTGAMTFEAAAFLRRNGADSIRVRLLFQNDMDAYKAKATAVRDAELFRGNMAISVCPSEVENSSLTAAQAADDLMNVTGIQASFVCCKVENMVYISARSFGDINVQRIMEKLGGGGHLTVAGAQLSDCTTEEAKEKIRTAIEEYLEEEA
ncbi:DHH family phosphoesterase [Anaerotignum lactatifermentans]|uniref:Cyclic-di-AMP phosphodiesterase n=1 Tax=Anaerotignum lactatifermentans TaxID=160404 RepID=A0ABS2GBH7_9FIRM|nr:DHH family phosphoesterase [Anaerotignum lactatifermentans]MBM6828586.1 DHH family phosphoesterase [Anaerotignum lactatifermentans]MBM6878542.1 DHH family phosphoesterase [Anaerotignum lactatifermentans]MBM6950168.1 DHH family phosphoesterase [Anaerotignum lactatifermentans]